MHLDTGAVELVFERGFAELGQGFGDVGRGLGEHRLDRPEQLDPEAREPRSSVDERGPRHGGQVAREHRSTAHQVGLEPGGPRHGFGHESLERPLSQLADQQPEQEFLLVPGRAREQLAQQAVLRLGRALAGGVGEALELGVDLGELYGRCSGRALGPHSLEGGVPDADPSLPGGAREKGDRGFDFLRSGLLQRGGEQVDLREPAARLGDAAGGLDEVVEAHG